MVAKKKATKKASPKKETKKAPVSKVIIEDAVVEEDAILAGLEASGEVVKWSDIVDGKAVDKNGRKLAVVKAIVPRAKKTLKALANYKMLVPVTLPASKRKGNSIYIASINGVQLVMRRGYIYFLPKPFADIIKENLSLPRRMREAADEVAKEIDPRISTDISDLE